MMWFIDKSDGRSAQVQVRVFEVVKSRDSKTGHYNLSSEFLDSFLTPFMLCGLLFMHEV